VALGIAAAGYFLDAQRSALARGPAATFFMSRAAAPAPRAETVAWQFVLAVAILAGAFLRWYQLGIQVLLDDEWHALNKLLRSGTWDIATSFGYADHSIPLTLYYRFLLEHGGLTEWVLHAPMLIAGIALLIVAPVLMRRSSSLPVTATWVVLLAISALLVYHSRTARPYALTSLLTLVAIVGFRRWWQSGSVSWGAAYVAATSLAGYLHPTTLPFTLLPFLDYGVRALVQARRGVSHQAWPALRRLFALGLATAIPLAAALGPPLYYDWRTLQVRSGVDSVSLESAYRTGLLLFGVAQPAAFVVLALLAIWGAVRLWSRDRDEAGYFATLIFGGALAVASAGSLYISHPLVLARYLLPVLPLLLLFLAEGVVACVERLPLAQLRPAAVGVLGAILWWLGPMPGYYYYPNQFMGHLRFQYDYDPAHNPYVQQVPRLPIPEFYRSLAQQPPGSLTLIEMPWRLESHFNPQPLYQAVHRQIVKIGLVTPVCGVRDYGEYPATVRALRLHEFAHLSSILDGKSYGADYLVMHLAPWNPPPKDPNYEWPDITACLAMIETGLGAPIYRDAQILVFDLRKKP
jgi:hypothetical protein